MDVTASLLNIDYLLSVILNRLNDQDLRKGLTKGYYITLIRNALKKLALQTFYNEVIIEPDMPENGVFRLPEDFFNLEALYAFNGDCCNPNAGSANIYFKRDFYTKDNRQGYTAMNKGNDQSFHDPYFQQNLYRAWDDPNGYLFANVQNSNLMLSRACTLGYSRLQIKYNSTGVELGEKPAIPNVLEEVVEDLVCYEACLTLLARYPKSAYGALFKIYDDKLYNRLTGTWFKSEDIVKDMHKWQARCNALYYENYGQW